MDMEPLPQIPGRERIERAIAAEQEEHLRRLAVVQAWSPAPYEGGTLLESPFQEYRPAPPPAAATTTAAAAVEQCPFNWRVRGLTGGGFVLYQASPFGTINGWLPVNTLTGGGSVEFGVPSGASFLKLACSASSGEVTHASFVLEGSTAAPIPHHEGVPPNGFEILLYVVVRSATGAGEQVKLYRVLACGNLVVTPQQVLVTSRPASEITCGSDPYLRHYTWRVESG